MRLNVATRYDGVTYEGAPAKQTNALAQLRRSVLSCLLWEKEFYEDGATIADRITALAAQVKPADVAALAVEARHSQNLRHVPLLLLCALAEQARGDRVVADTIERVISRADELAELPAVYWRNGRKPLSAQMKKGLARAFTKFDAYGFAKYDRDAAVKLADVIRMVRPKPADEARAALYKGVRERSLPAPDTWEVALSGGADKKEAFERLLREGKLGYLALLRNLRNMVGAGVDLDLVRTRLLERKGADKVLPFRFVAAARACPQLEPAIDTALCEGIASLPALSGRTAVLVDVSGSMGSKLSERSDLTRMDAAAALASVIHGDVRMFSFSTNLVEVPPRRGMAGIDALIRSQPHGGTNLFGAISGLNDQVPYDRLIVITDEQASGLIGGHTPWGFSGVQARQMPDPKPGTKGYVINVASAKNGVGYGAWTHIDGFSENVIRYIGELERNDA